MGPDTGERSTFLWACSRTLSAMLCFSLKTAGDFRFQRIPLSFPGLSAFTFLDYLLSYQKQELM